MKIETEIDEHIEKDMDMEASRIFIIFKMAGIFIGAYPQFLTGIYILYINFILGNIRS